MSSAANLDAHPARDRPVDNALWTWAKQALTALVDTVLPARCVECGDVVEGAAGFCAPCWSKLDFLVGPACARCDLPLPTVQGEGAECGACLADPPPYNRVVAALAYGPEARTMVMRFKYGRRVALGRMMARMMLVPLRPLVDHSRESFGQPPLLVPVPLHRWRLWWRGFNQAGVLAEHLSRALDVPMRVDGLVRTRATGSMRGQGRAARARAVRSAFAVSPRHAAEVAGRHVILIDDVFTTGATAAACTRTLLRAGAAQVSIATLARSLPGHVGLTGAGADPISEPAMHRATAVTEQ